MVGVTSFSVCRSWGELTGTVRLHLYQQTLSQSYPQATRCCPPRPPPPQPSPPSSAPPPLLLPPSNHLQVWSCAVVTTRSDRAAPTANTSACNTHTAAHMRLYFMSLFQLPSYTHVCSAGSVLQTLPLFQAGLRRIL